MNRKLLKMASYRQPYNELELVVGVNVRKLSWVHLGYILGITSNLNKKDTTQTRVATATSVQ